MAIKKITDLIQVDSLSDSDLLLVETADGTRAVAKNVIISNDERGKIAQTGFVAQKEPPENTSLLWLDTDDTNSEGNEGIRCLDIVLSSANWIQDQTYSNTYMQTVSSIQDLIYPDKTAIHCFVDMNTRMLLKAKRIEEIRIENNNGIPVAYLIGGLLTEDITIQAHIFTI